MSAGTAAAKPCVQPPDLDKAALQHPPQHQHQPYQHPPHQQLPHQQPRQQSLEQLLESRQWAQAVQVARSRVSSDPRDAVAWWGLARALLHGIREPEAAYTACCRALLALEQLEAQGGRQGAGGPVWIQES
jgi:hypothetical protein